MTIRTKLIKLLEYPNTIFSKFNGIHPVYAYYLESIKEITDKNFKTIIDVGASNGYYSKAAHHYYPNAQIYAFEPVPIRFEKIKRMPYVKAFPYGLWDKNDKSNFNIPQIEDFDDGSSFLEIGKENYIHETLKEQATYKKIDVERKRFDSLGVEIIRPCLLKIDVEGSEIFVLRGFGKMLKKIDILQLEVSFEENFKEQTKVSDLINYLEPFGFLGFIQKTLRWSNKYPNHCDLIFIRKEI